MIDATVIEIPFTMHGREGVVTVRYGPNASVEGAGFDLLAGRGFDVAMCLGYPTLEARVARYAGTGYRALMAWIQIVTDRFHDDVRGDTPAAETSEVDGSPDMRACGVPFFAHGYPAAMYDAPCNNLGGHARLEWVARTYMVTYPAPWNGGTISYVLGFRWGYDEWDEDGRRCVRVHPLELLGREDWERQLPLLREECPRWRYS